MNGVFQMDRNQRLALVCFSLVGLMVGAAYASVPLYELFCRVTGYGGTTQRAETGADRVLDRTITVRFDANVAGGLDWRFKPEVRTVTLKLGETTQIAYRAENTGATTSIATSTFNVTPPQAGAYFNKLACFCFTEQKLAAGAAMSMPVEFFVSPDAVDDEMMDSINTITLSYTFFPVRAGKELARSGVADRDENAEIRAPL